MSRIPTDSSPFSKNIFEAVETIRSLVSAASLRDLRILSSLIKNLHHLDDNCYLKVQMGRNQSPIKQPNRCKGDVMSESKILVTGATGKTGKDTVKFLLERGQAVRAMVRTNDDRSEALRKQGAEIVLGDLRNFESVRAALEGTRSAYFVFPSSPASSKALHTSLRQPKKLASRPS